MIEFLTTPKTAILFAIALSAFMSVFLTLFLVIGGWNLLGSLAFCIPLSVATVTIGMVAGAFVFHAHKKITN